MSTIEIVTERLSLRPFQVDDLEAIVATGEIPKSRGISRGTARIRWPMPSLS